MKSGQPVAAADTLIITTYPSVCVLSSAVQKWPRKCVTHNLMVSFRIMTNKVLISPAGRTAKLIEKDIDDLFFIYNTRSDTKGNTALRNMVDIRGGRLNKNLTS